MTESEGPGAAAPGPAPLALSVALELVTRYRLRLAPPDDARLGELRGDYELAAARLTGEQAAFVGFFPQPAGGLPAEEELSRRCAAALAWGRRRLEEQPAQRCDILLVALGPPAPLKPPALESGGRVTVGMARVDPATSSAEALLPPPPGLPGVRELRAHARRLRDGVEAPTLAAVDLAERQTIAGGYGQSVRMALGSSPVVTYGLLAAFAAVFVLERILLPTGRLSPGSRLLGYEDLGALANAGPLRGDWWRYVSSAFLHDAVQLFHILGNGMAMFFIGRLVEQLYGRLILLATFLVTAVAGGLVWVAATSLGLTQPGISIGASGGISGLMGLLLMLGRFQGRNIPAGVAASIRQWVATYAVLTLLFGFLLSSVNNFAHVGGFAAGVLLSLVLAPNAAVGGRATALWERAVMVAIVGAGAVALAIAGGHLVNAYLHAPMVGTS